MCSVLKALVTVIAVVLLLGRLLHKCLFRLVHGAVLGGDEVVVALLRGGAVVGAAAVVVAVAMVTELPVFVVGSITRNKTFFLIKFGIYDELLIFKKKLH